MSTPDAELRRRRRALRKASRSVPGHGWSHPAEELERVAACARANDLAQDHYGQGAVIEDLEDEVATLFDMPAACFMPSGSMAQLIALRIWADRAQNRHTAFHPTSHLELHEEHAYRELHGLEAHLLGDPERPTLARDLAELPALASLLVELPAREIGGQLPSWEELLELVAAARERGIRLHLDGARVWEAAAAYGRELAELGALFDSVYVSFYKGIGALPGAALLGPEDVVAEARVWRRRQGGTLYTALANAVSAHTRLPEQLQRMPSFHARAAAVAPLFAAVPGIEVLPDPPQTNMFHLLLQGEPAELELARDAVADEHGIWLFGGLRSTERGARTEIGIYGAALELSDAELQGALESFGASGALRA